jgi:hypothetical protein
MLSTLRWVDKLANENDVRWFCMPLDFLQEGVRRERIGNSLDLISRFPKLFMNFIVADTERMSIPAINDVAKLVGRIAKKSNNGFDNFRVGASCGCPANAPFFPFSRHEGDRMAFSFALESTLSIALQVSEELGLHAPIDSFRNMLLAKLVIELGNLQKLGEQIEQETGCQFKGLDASFAPFPGQLSVALLIERLLGAPVGSHGSLFITGMLTDTIRTAFIQSEATPVGFNGVMYSLLEDDNLASANSRRCLSLDGLIAMSAMCGCGVDMVPVPGNSFPEELAAVMLDIATMTLALKKPLGIRLLPIPGKLSNEFTQFNLDFLCDSRVMSLTANDKTIISSKHSFELLSPSRFNKI